MTFRRRLLVVGILTIFAGLAYGIAKYYSEALISCVVEEAFVQKLPSGQDPLQVRTRFRLLIDSLPNRQAKLGKLIYFSQYLEKLQILTPQELNQLLRKDSSSLRQDRSQKSPELFHRRDV